MRGTPERADLLGFMLGRKGMLLEPEGDDLFEMLGCGIALAGLPPADRLPRDLEQVCQSGLRQPDRRAQRQHPLAEGIVALPIRSSLHESSPFRTTQRVPPCNAMANDKGAEGA